MDARTWLVFGMAVCLPAGQTIWLHAVVLNAWSGIFRHSSRLAVVKDKVDRALRSGSEWLLSQHMLLTLPNVIFDQVQREHLSTY